MKLLEINVMDGKHDIQVAVSTEADLDRLYRFIADATKAIHSACAAYDEGYEDCKRYFEGKS